MTDNEQAFLDAAVGLHLPAVELLDHLDQYGDASPETRDALEKAIARFEAWRAAVIDEAWAKLPAEERESVQQPTRGVCGASTVNHPKSPCVLPAGHANMHRDGKGRVFPVLGSTKP